MPSRDIATRTVARPRAAPLAAVIRVRGASAAPERFVLAQGSCVIGAGSDVEILVDDPDVSRRHVELTLVPEGVALRDLGSRNGSYYLGQRLERAVLSLGSRIRIGSAEIHIELDGEALRGPAGDEDSYGELLGASEPMRQMFALLQRIEGSQVPVLIEGESGTGKELVARAIHHGSPVAEGGLVVLNCGAISKELVRSEMFGHRRGAFTGAEQAHRGAFVEADGGTLFLDEVGELPLDVQPVLLRALESGEIIPVGASTPTHVRTRVLAATNRSLSDEVAAGRFREDLYYRLAVVKLEVPALRLRRGDVRKLANRFAQAAHAPPLPDEVLAELSQRRWPGNVRELKNAVSAYIAIGALPEAATQPSSSGAMAAEAVLSQFVDIDKPYQDHRDQLVAEFSRVYFRKLLLRTGGNQSEAARQCGLERNYFRRLLQRYDVDT